MIVIRCPYCCELRNEEELTYGGQADVLRPVDPARVADAEWTDYLFMRRNPQGIHREQWCCTVGCGQWFRVARHTVTHEVIEVIRADQTFTMKEAP